MAYKEAGLEGGWQTVEPVHQPASPPQDNVDVIHLVSTLIPGVRVGTPRIYTFSGDATPRNTEVSFEQWYHKVQCVKDYYPEAVFWESIIWSLKEPAADMARQMGPTASGCPYPAKPFCYFGHSGFF